MTGIDPITLKALADFPGQLSAHYAAIPAGFKHWAPPSWDGVPSEPLTAIEQVCHVRDIEVDGYQVRFRRTLAEQCPTLPSLDTEGLSKARNYLADDAAVALAAFHRARQETLALLSSLDHEALRRPARFAGYGEVSLCSLVHYLCSHDQQHLAGLQWLLGKIESARPSG
jgi:hypothetical protein